MIYPWHLAAWQQLAAHWTQLPHACLFTGREHTGKTVFARHLAQALLCETPSASHEACGSCPSCHLFAQHSHPDFYEIAPEVPEGEAVGRKLLQIKIDAVRRLIASLQLTSVRGGRRVVLLHPAESLNIQAANALLKILEEPPEGVVFLLVSHARDKLLPTIKSRCRQWVLPPPDRAQALTHLAGSYPESEAAELLAFHSGAPLFEPQPEQDGMRRELLQLLSSPRLLAILDYAAAFDREKWPLALFLDWLQKWLVDVGLAQQRMAPLYYPAYAEALLQTAQRTDAQALFALQNDLSRLTPYGHHTLSVKMQAEYLLTAYLAFWQNK